MKIFGIGLSKTGTTSLSQALRILGLSTIDNPGVTHYVPGDLSSIDPGILEENDAFTDTPIPSFYRELDKHFPGSRFILTVRDMDGWLLSCKKQFTQKLSDKQNSAHNRLFTDLYDCTVFDEQKFRKGYENFVNGVMEYFSDRPGDLLVMDVSAGDGWEKLCPFLDRGIPGIPFPKANVTKIRWMNINDITAIARLAGREALEAFRYVVGDSAAPVTRSNTVRFRHLRERLLVRIRKDPGYAFAAAQKAAMRIIEKRLKQLNPEIPVITSKTSSIVTDTNRKKWNHFWLVDPLHGDNSSTDPDSTLTLSIALVEDRKPIIGVVHAPAIDTTYYAMTGQGAFRQTTDEHPVQLAAQTAIQPSDMEDPDHKAVICMAAQAGSDVPAQGPLSLCRLAEENRHRTAIIERSMEWQTAAADAVLRAVGRQISDYDTGETLSYNKTGFANMTLVIR
jgi:3'-phosphoadenosine 5'-phosphosulfate (PAPS) 3'-phosphatase